MTFHGPWENIRPLANESVKHCTNGVVHATPLSVADTGCFRLSINHIRLQPAPFIGHQAITVSQSPSAWCNCGICASNRCSPRHYKIATSDVATLRTCSAGCKHWAILQKTALQFTPWIKWSRWTLTTYSHYTQHQFFQPSDGVAVTPYNGITKDAV